MELRNKLAASMVALIVASSPALAEGPKWDLAELGYVQTEIDGDDFSPSGFNASFSKALGEGFYLTGRYRDVSEDVNVFGQDVDVDLSQLSLGGGYRFNVTESTDVYAQVTYENLEVGASAQGNSESEDDNGFGATIGVRSMVTNALELGANISYLDIAEESETALGVSAYYYFTDNIAVGATYEAWDGVDFISLNARYAF